MRYKRRAAATLTVLTAGALLLAGGVIADRLSRRKLMMAADILRLCAQGAMAALIISGNAYLWQLIALEAVRGGASAFFQPASTGILPLREAIVTKVKRDNGLPVDNAEQVVVTNGGMHALYLIFRSLLDPGDEVIIPDPMWTEIAENIRLADERRFFRSIDYGVIGARIEALYAFAAHSLGEPRVESLLRDGVPAYAWPTDAREPWLDGGGRVLPRLFAWATGVQRT